MSAGLFVLLALAAVADDLRDALRVLGATPRQVTELTAEPERAFGWVEWARRTGKGIAAVVAEYRTGLEAPDVEAFYAAAAAGKRGQDYPTLLRSCESLVANTGHEHSDEDLLAEFERLGASAKVGNGARLTDDDRGRLLRNAGRMRERWEQAEAERAERAPSWTARYYVELVRTGRVSREQLERSVLPRLRGVDPGLAAEIEEELPPPAEVAGGEGER